MTRKQRHLTAEAVALAAVVFLLSIVLPALVNAHETMAAFAAFMLLSIAVGWAAYFLYRLNKETPKL